MSNLTAVGLVYDIVGVCILALALMGTRTLSLFQQAATKWDGNKALFKVLLLQRTDARFGLPIVVVGFALQLAGAIGLKLTHSWLWLVFPFLILAVALVSYVITRSWQSRTSDSLYDKLLNTKDRRTP